MARLAPADVRTDPNGLQGEVVAQATRRVPRTGRLADRRGSHRGMDLGGWFDKQSAAHEDVDEERRCRRDRGRTTAVGGRQSACTARSSTTAPPSAPPPAAPAIRSGSAPVGSRRPSSPATTPQTTRATSRPRASTSRHPGRPGHQPDAVGRLRRRRHRDDLGSQDARLPRGRHGPRRHRPDLPALRARSRCRSRGKNIDSIADLKGKKVGTWLGGNEPELYADLKKNGIDPATRRT